MNARRTFAVWLLLSVGLQVSAAEITATVDRNVVGVNESFQLTFEADDSTEEPDFSPLHKDFEVLNQAHSKNLSIINGQTSRQLVWDLVLMATKTGGFQIPPISFGADKSQAISIKVKQKVDKNGDGNGMYLDVKVDTEQPYVQQQVIFTIRLFLRQGEVSSATLSELNVDGADAIVERLGEDKNYQEMRDGLRWRVVERKYLIFPQQSGHMTIGPLEFRGHIRSRSSVSNFDIFSQSLARRFVLRSESITLPVREPPASFNAQWLPAKNVTLDESWPIEGEIKVGDPITRKVSIQAVGLTAAQLPELNILLPDSLRAYPEQAKLENAGDAEGVTGRRIETTAIIPTQPGTITLPEVQLAWWNVDKQQPELASIPARTIEVGGIVAQSEPIAPSPVSGTLPAQAGTSTQHDSQFEQSSFSTWWPWVSLGLGVAWLITVIMWVIDRQGEHKSQGTIGELAPRADPRRALAELRRATQSNNGTGSRDALLEWGRALWPQTPPTNLGQLARLCGEPLSSHIRDLEQVLYAHKTDWDSKPLALEVLAFKVDAKGAPRQDEPLLEPLYRS